MPSKTTVMNGKISEHFMNTSKENSWRKSKVLETKEERSTKNNNYSLMHNSNSLTSSKMDMQYSTMVKNKLNKSRSKMVRTTFKSWKLTKKIFSTMNPTLCIV